MWRCEGTWNRRRRRLPQLSGKTGAVEVRVERRVVVHLHLAVDFELLAAGLQVGNQLAQRPGEVGMLDAAAAEPLGDFLLMSGVDVIAGRLLFEVEDAQGHDR